MCLTLKTVRHKPYGDLQSLLLLIHWWKNLSIDFVTGLPISTNWKGDSYNSILVIVDWLTKMVYYKSVKIFLDAPGLGEVIIDVVVWHRGLFNSIVIDKDSLFTSKFWSLLCYFFSIKRGLFTAFHSQTDNQTKRQNSIIKTNLQAFVNFEQNNGAKLLPMAEFAYNNAKKASTGHTPFKLNWGYHPCVFFEQDIDPCS